METAMTEIPSQKQTYRLEFFGKGSEYFSIMIVNWLLTLFTLGLYYPWARAKRLKYVYSHTALNNERFYFSGTGSEMFKGFIKILMFYFVVMSVYVLLATTAQMPNSSDTGIVFGNICNYTICNSWFVSI